MNIRWRFRFCAKHKNAVREYWQRKLPRLEKLLARSSGDKRQLDMTLYRHPTENRWEMRAVLQLATGVLVANDEGEDIYAVADTVAEELARHIIEHRVAGRREHSQRRRRTQRAKLRAATRWLEADVQSDRPGPFFDLLKPLLSVVRDHAHSELAVLELEGVIPKGEVTDQDLVDDVLVAAWESFSKRPHDIPIDIWLIGILRERLAEVQRSYGEVKLSSPLEYRTIDDDVEPDIDDRAFWLSRALQPPEQLTLEDVLPDSEDNEPPDRLDREEQRQRVWNCIQQLQKPQRQALVLTAVHGFELTEVAMALDRSKDQVQEDIDQARITVREMMAPDFHQALG
jgi:ribosomal subunit interface protein